MGQVYKTASGKTVTLDKLLGGGGEGDVWTVQGRLEVAKLYHPQVLKPEYEQKLKAMVANPPVDEMRVKGHVSIAWPTELLYRAGKFAGFLMPMVEKSPSIFTVYNPVKRKKNCPGFNWKYLLHTALNLSKAVEAIHIKNYVIGDLNESNILVKPSALVSIIDTDSFQVRDTNGQVYRCKVGKEDFTPPELQGVALDKLDRLPEHDYFSLGVLIFRLLMEGFYPFSGVLKQEIQTNEAAQFYCLKKGAFPYVSNAIVSPPPLAPKFDSLPREVRNLFLRCFVAGNKNLKARPSPSEWVQVLETAEKELVVCKVNKEHYYWQRLAQCPWCEREAGRQKARLQTALPPVRTPRPSRTRLLNTATARASAPLPLPSKPPNSPTVIYPRSASAIRLAGSLQDRVRKFFITPGGSLTWRAWWLETRNIIALGALIGIGVSFLVLLMFTYPVTAGYTAGAITAGLILVLTMIIARQVFYLRFRLGRAVGVFILLLGIALTVLDYLYVSDLARTTVAAVKTYPEWLFLDGLLLGTIGGTSYGSYKTLSRRKSKALAFAVSLVLALAAIALIWLSGLFDLPFQFIA